MARTSSAACSRSCAVPDGATGQCFFQKHASAGVDAKRLASGAPSRTATKSIAVDDLDGLIALAQAGAPRNSHRAARPSSISKKPTGWCSISIPAPASNGRTRSQAAREVRERLARFDLETFIKTSGGKGLHVVLPIKPTPWEEAKGLCRGIAEAMERDDPKPLHLDGQESRRAATGFSSTICATAAKRQRSRPTRPARAETAPVSVPITWDELKTLKSANQYTVRNLSQRLSRLRSDPWAGIGRVDQALPKLRK